MPTISQEPGRIAERYPLTLRLSNGSALMVSPVGRTDLHLLDQFVQNVPFADRGFLYQDLSVIVERWCADLDEEHCLPLLARRGERIVADASLHLEPEPWMSHIGKLRVFVHPDERGCGIGSALVGHLQSVAAELGRHKLVCECAAEQSELIALLRKLLFREEARLPEFIRDPRGRLHDMVLMACPLR